MDTALVCQLEAINGNHPDLVYRIYKDTYSIFYVCTQTLCFRVVDIAKEGMPRLLNFHIIWKIFNCNKDTNEVA